MSHHKHVGLYQAFRLLSFVDSLKFVVLTMVSILNGLVQTLGIISIMPFIALVAEPGIINSNPYIQLIRQFYTLDSYESTLIAFGAFTFLALLISNMFSVFGYWASLHFFNYREFFLARDLLDIFVSKRSQAFARIKKTRMLKYVLSDIERVLIGTQMTIVDLISDVVVLLCVLATLLYMDVLVTLATSAVLAVSYFGIYLALSKKINRYGAEFAYLDSKVYEAANQALSLFREMRIFGKKDKFINDYSRPSEKLARHSVRYYAVSFIPMQLLELMAFVVVIVIAIYYSTGGERSVHAVTAISLFAFATYRLVPVFKSLFDNWESLAYNRKILGELLDKFRVRESDESQMSRGATSQRLCLKKDISIERVSFRYQGSKNNALNTISLRISSGKFTCLSGRSGIGKSTLLDLILGLHRPSEGEIKIDGEVLDESNIRSWQNAIGYVPQKFKWVNGSVYQNIAFGVPDENIDKKRVLKVAKLAMIHDKIVNDLSAGYRTYLGDGAIQLSGGEKQRLSIARSLYHDPQILILDEATNELDSKTEKAVVSNLKGLRNKTIIFVSHKPSILEMADNHVRIER